MSNATEHPTIRAAAREVAYSDDCESPADFRYGLEQRFPEIAPEDIRTLWHLARDGDL